MYFPERRFQAGATANASEANVVTNEKHSKRNNMDKIFFIITFPFRRLQLAAQIVMKVFQLSPLCCKIVFAKVTTLQNTGGELS